MNWPDSDKDLKTLANSMWGENPEAIGEQTIGKGRLVWGRTPASTMWNLRGREDFEARGNDECFVFIHRVIDDADFYFVSNQANQVKTGDFLFRVNDLAPELWDPVTGLRRDLSDFAESNDGRRAIAMTFEPYQSFFVVFRKPATRWRAPAAR